MITLVDPEAPKVGDKVTVVVRVKDERLAPQAHLSIGWSCLGGVSWPCLNELQARAVSVDGPLARFDFQLPQDTYGRLLMRPTVADEALNPVELWVFPAPTRWWRSKEMLQMLGGAGVILLAAIVIALRLRRSARKAKADEEVARRALEENRTKTQELEKKLIEVQSSPLPPRPSSPTGSSSDRALTPAAGIPQVFPEGVIPDVPEELIRALAAKECVLYAGAGLGAQAGYPTWPQVLARLLESVVGPAAQQRASPQSKMSGYGGEGQKNAVAAELWMRHRRGQWSAVAEYLRTQVDREVLLNATRALFPDRELPRAHELLGHLPFAGAFTSSWDVLLSRAFEHRHPVTGTPRDPDRAVRAFGENTFFLVQLFGGLDPASFVFSNDEYRELMSTSALARFVGSVVTGRTMLFIGASVDGLETVFSDLRLGQQSANVGTQAGQRAASPPSSPRPSPLNQKGGGPDTSWTSQSKSPPQQTVIPPLRRHFALVPDEPEWSVARDVFRVKYGVECLVYRPTPGHGEVAEFLHRLHQRVAAEHRAAADATLSRPTRLRSVRLTNIGRFPTLELNLNEGWNVLLGNNGCGKTTLLRAIALGLCGDDPKAAPAARWLLAAGQHEGSIELEVGNNVYRTELKREGDRVRVISRLLTPLQSGGWVVLGFPPLRGVSTHEPKGPLESGAGGPTVDDLLPLLLGGVDDRLDNVKQWIVNEYLRSGRKRSPRLDDFFDLLRDLTPGLSFDFAGVEPDTFRVMVKVEDGSVVPLDRLSQGMAAVHGWVGTLLQRMHEIRDAAARRAREAGRPEPPPVTETPALVLVDEVDAHLHPEWQQKLVGLVRHRFPNVQIVVTTHSPLIIADMEKKEIFTADRDSHGDLCIVPAAQEVRGRRADQILISMFGLKRTRTATRYVELSERAIHGPPLTADEQKELDGLREAMDVHGSETERRVSVAVKQALGHLKGEAGNAALEPEEEAEVHRRLSKLFGRSGPNPGEPRR
ncbi:MAG TPA: AAA family ATPase [Myxococcaceae bacterium]|nr:AAA family ATPase [Myxococcaceae bacterium]